MVEKYQRVIAFGILGWVIEEDMAHRIWVLDEVVKSASVILCDHRISTKKKGKLYRTTVKPTMLNEQNFGLLRSNLIVQWA